MRRGESLSQEVFGLRCEFIFQHGHYMALYKDEGLDACELSTLQVSMLEANQVPNLLPLQIQEADHRIRLLYNVSAKRMLSHVLKVDRLSTQHVATFMYAIVSTLVESRNYMLNEMGFVLKENFIFLGSDWSDVYLTYVPLEGVKEEEYVIFKTLASLMKQLLLKLNDEERLVAELWMESLAKIQSLQGYKESLLAFMDEQPRLQEVVQSVKHTYEEAGEDLSSVQLQQPPIVENSLPKPLRHLVEEQSVFKPNGGGDQETNDGQGNPLSVSSEKHRRTCSRLLIIPLLEEDRK